MKPFALAAALLAVLSAPACATLYTFDYTSGPDAVSLLIDVPDDSATADTISGTRNGIAVTGLSDYAGADNTFDVTAPYVSGSGLSYTVGGVDYNLFEESDFTNVDEINSATDPDGDGVGALRIDVGASGLASAVPPVLPITGGGVPPAPSAAAVPEAATWAMMLVGFGVIGVTMRGARRHSGGLISAQ